jgi:hypothetical protein
VTAFPMVFLPHPFLCISIFPMIKFSHSPFQVRWIICSSKVLIPEVVHYFVWFPFALSTSILPLSLSFSLHAVLVQLAWMAILALIVLAELLLVSANSNSAATSCGIKKRLREHPNLVTQIALIHVVCFHFILFWFFLSTSFSWRLFLPLASHNLPFARFFCSSYTVSDLFSLDITFFRLSWLLSCSSVTHSRFFSPFTPHLSCYQFALTLL